jgi:hypothetical protein
VAARSEACSPEQVRGVCFGCRSRDGGSKDEWQARIAGADRTQARKRRNRVQGFGPTALPPPVDHRAGDDGLCCSRVGASFAVCEKTLEQDWPCRDDPDRAPTTRKYIQNVDIKCGGGIMWGAPRVRRGTQETAMSSMSANTVVGWHSVELGGKRRHTETRRLLS